MPSLNFTTLLPDIPGTLRDEVLAAFCKIETNFRESRWEPSELNGGKLCEVVYTILEGYVGGAYPTNASKPSNMIAACQVLEKHPATILRSVRIQIPRMLIALYEIRNNRGVGHVGGEVNPNYMDSLCVLQMSKWIVCELIRIYHKVSIEEAASIVDAISEREISLIWKVGDTKRVLDVSLSMLDKTLVLLYSEPSGISESNLISYVEHSNSSVYRRDVLRRAHEKRLLEYNSKEKTAVISPLGSRRVEEQILVQSGKR